MQFYPHRTVEEQAARLPRELREAYKNSQIDRITIFDGTNEIEITGYAEYSYLEEKSYKTQPIRTEDGAIQEIEEYATFLTPRLIIKYNMMNIEDYRSLMKMLKSQNGFMVKCYDIVEDKIVKREMYHAPPSMPIIYQQYLKALGIQEYVIELIGTNTRSKVDLSFTVSDVNYVYKVLRGFSWKELCEIDPSFSISDGNVFWGIEGSYIYYKNSSNTVNENDYILNAYEYST